MPKTRAAPPATKAARAKARRIGDIWQGLVTRGRLSRTSGEGWRVFLYGLCGMATIAGAVNIVNVIGMAHEKPDHGLAGPIVWEGSSWGRWRCRCRAAIPGR